MNEERQPSNPGLQAAPCPRCGGRGFLRMERDGYPFVKKCECRKSRDTLDALDRAGIPPKFRNTTLHPRPSDGRAPFKPYGGGRNDKLALRSGNEALQICRKLRDLYLNVFLNGKKSEDLYGLLLHGSCGLGKTRLACSLLCDLVYAGLYDVRFIEYNELFKLIRFSFNSSEITYEGIFGSLTGAKVLVIDDFGMDVSSNLIWVLDNIGYVLNERYARNLPTVLTCNYWQSIRDEAEGSETEASPNPFESPSWELGSRLKEAEQDEALRKEVEEVKNRVSYRLRSRIREMCYEFKLDGYDYRKRIGKNRDILMEKAKQSKAK